MATASERKAYLQRSRSRIAAQVFLEPATAPGYLRPLPDSPPPAVSVLRSVSGETCVSYTLDDLGLLPLPAKEGVHWVRVCGLGAIDPLVALCEFYGISRPGLEDVLATGWRTRLKQEEKFIYFILQGPPALDDRRAFDRLVLFFCPGLIITFEDRPTCVVDHLWERLQKENAAVQCDLLAEFLTYMVLDILVDGFFPHLDKTDENLAQLEEDLLSHVPRRSELNLLYTIKRDLTTLRRLITPFKEVRSDLLKCHPPEVAEELKPFFHDLSDHISEVDTMLDTYHEVTITLDQTCQSMIGNRVNEIVRILTIVSTLFLPLSLIAGIFGMNFESMPGIAWSFGFMAVIGFMGALVLVLLLVFRRTRWL